MLSPTSRSLLRITTAGSVDDGKSTLIGRLLYEAHAVYDDQLLAIENAKRTQGKLDLSLLADGLKSEREQGITIDVAYKYFSSQKRKYILADAPGHLQYTRNMVTASSLAHAIILLIDARRGILEQTRRHAYIANLLGVPHIIIAINKIDMIAYDPKKIAAIEADLQQMKWIDSFRSVQVIPVSALHGDNISSLSPLTPWYQGDTLLNILDELPPPQEVHSSNQPSQQNSQQSSQQSSPQPSNQTSKLSAGALLGVQIILRNPAGERLVAGTLAQGSLQIGDLVEILPSKQHSRIKELFIAGQKVPFAFPGDTIALTLEDQRDVERGNLLRTPQSTVQQSSWWQAQVVWFDQDEGQIDEPYLLRLGTQTTKARVSKIVHRFDLETLTPVAAKKLSINDIATVEITCSHPLFALPYKDSHIFGAFILIHPRTNRTVAAGMIVSNMIGCPATHSQENSLEDPGKNYAPKLSLPYGRLHRLAENDPLWQSNHGKPGWFFVTPQTMIKNTAEVMKILIVGLLDTGWHVVLEECQEARELEQRLGPKRPFN